MTDVINLNAARYERSENKTVPQPIADALVVGQLFSNVTQLELIASWLIEANRHADASLIHIYAGNLRYLAKRLKVGCDAAKG